MARPRKRRPVSLPGKNADVDLVAAEVDNPYDPAKKIIVMKNSKEHPLETLHSRGRISDAQKKAGDDFLRIHDRAIIGGACAIDYSRVKVDVSFVHKGLQEGIAGAIQEMNAIQLALGTRAFLLLLRVIGGRFMPFQLAADNDYDRYKMFKTFQEALDDLSDFLGAAKGPARGKIRAERNIISMDAFAGLTDHVPANKITDNG